AHKSDTIIDARIIDEASALVTEITNKGYEYKLVALDPYKESPFEYTYFTEREPHAEILSQSINTPIDTPADDNRTNFKLNEKAYSSFSHWQFNGIDPYIFFGVDTPAVAQLNFRFSDPLQNHSLNMLLSSGSYNEYAAGLHYINSKYVVNWDLLTLFQKTSAVASNPNNPDDYEILDRYDDWLGALGFEYLIYNRTQWQVGLSSHFVYQNENPTLASIDADKKYTVLTQINVAHLVSTPIAYNPYKSLNLDLANEYIRSAPGWSDQRNIYGGEITASYDLFRETYLSASYQAAYTDSPFAIVYFDNGPDDFPYPTPTQVSRNTKYIDQDYFEVRKVSTELKQAINLSFYTTKFPLSLRRMAIFAQYNEYYGATVRREDPGTLFHEAGGGIEMELLLLNKFPFRARWVGYKSSYSDDASSIVVLGANQTF
ncbi:MAG: hypothetical protein KDD38_11020, partial [Bdellovibrionales bacterium]|nr:hypothetical protein [Bdellovibrionales bacterium]